MKIRTKVTKQLLGMVLCLALMLTDVPLTVFAMETHSHPICGASHTDIGDHTGACSDIIWTKWDSANSMPTEAGAYYLDGDVTLSSSWEIPEGVEISLCLNGHSVSGNHAVRVVTINQTATLNLCDCSTAQTGKITEGYISNTSGAGVWVARDSRFNMYGGSIVQNETSNQGGGVYIFRGTFNMYGGVVSKNTASDGAGVYNNEGTISIYAGGITDNIATGMGGGVFNSGKFNMTGGTISANKVTGYQQYCNGGGVYHNGGTFEMSGGTISGNSAENGAGIYTAFLSKWLVSGTPAIHDAICLNSNQYGTSYITVSGALNDGALFAATNRGVGETIAIGTDTYSITENDAAKFATNEGRTYLDSVGNRLVLCNDAHPEYQNGACKTCGAECEHSLVHESNQNVITERCNAESDCGHEEKATLSANLQIYSGSALTPATIRYSEGWRGEKVEDSAITYSNNINVGFATASVEIEEKTITTTFEICPEHIESASIILNPASSDYNGMEQRPDISVSYVGVPLIENTDYTLSWNKSGFKNADNYTVTITGMGNFAYEIQKTFDITPKEIEFAWGGVNFMPYTGQLVLPEVTATNLADGDTCEVLVSVVETVDGAGINPGKWTARITGLSNGNYKLPKNSSVLLEVEYTIYAHQTAPHVSGVAETIKGKNDGYISGLTAEMEYATEATDRDSAYTKITDPNMIFAPGTYYVRYAAKEYYYSSPYTVVTVAEGRKLTITLPSASEQIGYTIEADKTALSYGDDVCITLNSKDGYSRSERFAIYHNGVDVTDGYGSATNSLMLTGVTGDVTITIADGSFADTAAPTAEIKIENNNWTSFWNGLTFGLFFKETQDVTITAADVGSGVKNIQYYLSDRELERDEVETITDWIDYNGTFQIDPDNKYVVYAKIADNGGNVTYINSEGIVLDATLPVISGIENGKTYYTTQKVAVTEAYVEDVTVNGQSVTLYNGAFTLAGNVDTIYTIEVTDKAGNTATVTVTMKPIKELAKATENLGSDNVTSADAPALKELVEKLDELIADPDTSDDGEKETLEQHKVIAESLLKTIEDAAKAADTENTEKVEDITTENVTPEDKADLEKAKDDLEKALEDYEDNYTDDEKKAIQDEIQRIDDALSVIDRVEAVEEVIETLPDPADPTAPVEPDDKEAIDAYEKAQEVYDKLTDYEKSLVDEALTEKLENLAQALASYKILEGIGADWTKDGGKTLTFKSNGYHGKLDRIEVDGKIVDAKYYEVKAGSTIITIKAEFLQTLSVGQHPFKMVYRDGECHCLFDVKAAPVVEQPSQDAPASDSPVSDAPLTGDTSHMFLWIALLLTSGGAVTALAVVDRKRKAVRR